jgi:multidrug resistance efflux pump
MTRSKTAPRQASETVPLLVEGFELTPATVVEPIVGYGTARADRYARISSQVAGEVIELADQLKPGTRFKQGEVLLRIDSRDYKHALQQAEAAYQSEVQRLARFDVEQENLKQLIEIVEDQLEIQEKEYERVRELHEQQYAPSSEYNQKLLQVESLRAQLQTHKNALALIPSQRESLKATIARLEAGVEQARLMLQRCTIKAPFDGQIDDLHVELGEQVQVGGLLLTFLDPLNLEIPIELPVSLRDRVRVGADCMLNLESSGRLAWEGTVNRISPTADEQTRTFSLYVEVSQPRMPDMLMPGTFVRAVIEGPTLTNALIVPRTSILDDTIFIYQDGVARVREIEVDRWLEERASVEGIEPGVIVITSNLDMLFEGARVRWANDRDATADVTTTQEADKLLAGQ